MTVLSPSDWLKQPDTLIVAQGIDTQPRLLSNLSDSQSCFHALSIEPGVDSRSRGCHATLKKERRTQTYLRPEEYARLLSAVGSNLRDFAILQLFLQTGIRVSELVHLTLKDVDLVNKVLRVDGKGSKERMIPLEKKAIRAIKNYKAVRPLHYYPPLFTDYRIILIVKKWFHCHREANRPESAARKQRIRKTGFCFTFRNYSLYLYREIFKPQNSTIMSSCIQF